MDGEGQGGTKQHTHQALYYDSHGGWLVAIHTLCSAWHPRSHHFKVDGLRQHHLQHTDSESEDKQCQAQGASKAWDLQCYRDCCWEWSASWQCV